MASNRKITWVHLLFRRFEGDPKTQYVWHKWAMRFWLVNAVVMVAVFAFAPSVWMRVSVLYLVLVSLYANWCTDFGSMSAAEAAAKGPVSAYSVDMETETTTEGN